MPNIPYGSWPSPLSAKQVIDTSCSPVDLSIDRGRLYWLELRPQENSRLTLMSLINNAPVELTPSPFNVRSRVHEYGGGAYTTSGNQIFFCNAEDQRIYRLDPRVNLQQPQPITEPGPFRYADIQLDLNRNRLICVRESHAETSKNNPYPINQLVAIDIDTGEQNVLVSGADFYSSPKISPNHQALCWLSWSHPHMPWDAAELHQGQINSDGLIVNQQHVAGSDQESVFQPEWDMNGELVFVSDRSGWWNLYRHGGENIQCLYDAQMEFGRPQLELAVVGNHFGLAGFQGLAVSAELGPMVRFEGGHCGLKFVDPLRARLEFPLVGLDFDAVLIVQRAVNLKLAHVFLT
ncbi:MAG: hypothetical protein COB04_17090, partial [Gammaproteobacteria bacterium]